MKASLPSTRCAERLSQQTKRATGCGAIPGRTPPSTRPDLAERVAIEIYNAQGVLRRYKAD